MIHALFSAYAATPLSQFIRHSSWAFAITEMFHLMALSLLGGALLIAVMGVSGIALVFGDRAGAWRGLRRLIVWAFAAAVVTGFLMVGTNPLKYFFNDSFRIKMLLLGLALVLTLATDAILRSRHATAARIMAPLSLILWLGVALAGRLIGFL
jgi:hypothetical protein